jgi:hypothetical protein
MLYLYLNLDIFILDISAFVVFSFSKPYVDRIFMDYHVGTGSGVWILSVGWG